MSRVLIDITCAHGGVEEAILADPTIKEAMASISPTSRQNQYCEDPPQIMWRFTYRLVGRHPYLARHGLYEMAAHEIKLAALEAQANQDDGPFSDHLRRLAVSLTQDRALSEVVRKVFNGQSSVTTERFYPLRSADLMVGDSERDVRLRCQLYATYLEKHLL